MRVEFPSAFGIPSLENYQKTQPKEWCFMLKF